MATDADANHVEEELTRRNDQIEDLRDELRYARDRIADADDRTGGLHKKIARLDEDDRLWKRRVAEFEEKVALLERENEESAGALAAATSDHKFEVQKLREDILKSRESARDAQASVDFERTRATDLQAEAGNAGGRLEAKKRDVLQFQDALSEEKAAEALRQTRLAERKNKEAAERLEEARSLLSKVSGQYAAQKAKESNHGVDLAKEKECSDGLNVALRHTQEKKEELSLQCDRLEAELTSSKAIAEATQQHAQQTADVEHLVGRLNDSQRGRQRLTQELAELKREATFQLSGVQGAMDETKRMMDDHLDQTRSSPEAADSDPSILVVRTQIRDERARFHEITAASRSFALQREALEERQRQAAEDKELDTETSLAQERSQKISAEFFAAKEALTKAQRKAAEARELALMAEAEVPDVRISSAERETALRLKLEELWGFLRQMAVQMHTVPFTTLAYP